MNALLECTGIGKAFGGVQALDDVGFSINPGEIYGLIGPNGAGKTTLFNVLTGLYVADRGTVQFEGASLTGFKPHEIVTRGIARTFQNIRLFANPAGCASCCSRSARAASRCCSSSTTCAW